MTKEEYDNYTGNLINRGYKYAGSRYNEPPYYYKALEYRYNEDEKNRAVCQLLVYLYDTPVPLLGKHFYSVEPVVDVSRNIGERITLTLSHPKHSVEECERIAKEFMRFANIYIDEEQE